MEAISKSGKVIHGKIAEILINRGSATPFESNTEPEKTPVKTKTAPKKVVKKVAKKAPKKKK
jgi:hypothetical protein